MAILMSQKKEKPQEDESFFGKVSKPLGVIAPLVSLASPAVGAALGGAKTVGDIVNNEKLRQEEQSVDNSAAISRRLNGGPNPLNLSYKKYGGY